MSEVIPSDEEIAVAERAAKGYDRMPEQAKAALDAAIAEAQAVRDAAREESQRAYERFLGRGLTPDPNRTRKVI